MHSARIIKVSHAIVLLVAVQLANVQQAGYAQAAAALPDKAIVKGDYLRVRDTPGLAGKYRGVLFKNMLVKVSERSKSKTKIKGESHYWYKIEYNELRGWCYGKFLSFKIPDKVPDTYYASADMSWYYKRFGYGTAFSWSGPKVGTFNIDEYRSLMAATLKGDNLAWAALHLTIYPHLKQHPDDKAYQYLKKRLYSSDFVLSAYKKSGYVDNSFHNLPKKIIMDDSFYQELKGLPGMKWALQFYPKP